MSELVPVKLALATKTSENDLNIKTKPKKVLDEEAYSENVERIIVRDFFPDHQNLTDEKEYLEAEERKDFEKMRQIALKYAAGGTRGATPASFIKNTPLPSPAAFETPLAELKRPSTDRSGKPVRKSQTYQNEDSHFGYKKKSADFDIEEEVKDADKDVGLDKFLYKYTSEDNDSFETIMERSEQARRDKHAWLYEAEKSHAEMTQQILQLEDNQSKPLAITDGLGEAKQGQSSSGETHKTDNSRATVPVHTWEYKNKNALMYYPEGINPNDDDAIFKKPRLINHDNTRFQSDPFKNAVNRTKISQIMNESKNMAGEKVGHDGKSVIPHESPRVGGYGFVATPSPMPGVNESPLMTWGEVESTPARLEPSSTPGPAFRFPEESERDKLTHRMVDANTKKKRAKKQEALKQMTASVLGTPNRPGSIKSMERINTLSPAARRLVNKKFNLGSDRALKASYTPTPSQRRHAGGDTPIVKTPTPRKTPKNTPTPRGESDITDNLLNIPDKRRRAASDFF